MKKYSPYKYAPHVLGFVLIFAACEAPPSPSAPPSPQTSTKALTSPQTALLVMQLTPTGEARVAATQVKNIPWVDPLLEFKPSAYRTADKNTKTVEARTWNLHLLVHHPSHTTTQVLPLKVSAPGHTEGDVLDPWTLGSALWRAPWYGESTSYELWRVDPGPALRLTPKP